MLLIFERKIVHDPKEIIGKFLAVILFYAGLSIIYFSFSGEPFLGESRANYDLYIFIIGFIAVLWTVPELLSEFEYFRKFMEGKKEKRKK
jgi:hypothetical protein